MGPVTSKTNRLLETLPAADYRALGLFFERVKLPLGHTLYGCGKRIDYAYLPIDSVVSFLHPTEDGSTVEVGIVGNDGLVGITVCLGGTSMPHRAVVCIGGEALRMPTARLVNEFNSRAFLRSGVLRYAQSFLTQISQTAVCNRLHPVEKRLCRTLLLCHDRVPSNDFSMTQEFLSSMLGGRRESVTVAAGGLQNAGVIRYSRGRIYILDRQGLEASACECYQLISHEYPRLVSADKKPTLPAPPAEDSLSARLA